MRDVSSRFPQLQNVEFLVNALITHGVQTTSLIDNINSININYPRN